MMHRWLKKAPGGTLSQQGTKPCLKRTKQQSKHTRMHSAGEDTNLGAAGEKTLFDQQKGNGNREREEREDEVVRKHIQFVCESCGSVSSFSRRVLTWGRQKLQRGKKQRSEVSHEPRSTPRTPVSSHNRHSCTTEGKHQVCGLPESPPGVQTSLPIVLSSMAKKRGKWITVNEDTVFELGDRVTSSKCDLRPV